MKNKQALIVFWLAIVTAIVGAVGIFTKSGANGIRYVLLACSIAGVLSIVVIFAMSMFPHTPRRKRKKK